MISHESTPIPEAVSTEVSIEQLVREISEEIERRESRGLETILFIPVTGGEGCGKTTLLKALTKLLEGQHIPVVTVKMLGGQETTDAIRALVLAKVTAKMSSQATIHLLQASQLETADTLHERISGARRLVILADRSPWDAAVYQQRALGASLESAQRTAAQNLGIFAQAGIPPSTTFYIDLDPVIGLGRKFRQGGDEVTRFEEMDLTFHKALRQGFCTLSEKFPDYITVLDGTLTPLQMQLQAVTFMHAYLAQHDEETIVGQPPRLDQINRWIRPMPIRAAMMLNTLTDLSYQDSQTYLNLWRGVAFALRDNDVELADIETIVRLFTESPIINNMADFSLNNPVAFFESISKKNAEGIKSSLWEHCNYLIEQVTRECRNRSSYGSFPADTKW